MKSHFGDLTTHFNEGDLVVSDQTGNVGLVLEVTTYMVRVR